jgi:hypothetical protein
MALRKVTITLTNKIIGNYEARSYPHDCYTDDNFIELYKVPVYEIQVSGTDDSGANKTIIHKAPRFMPYWNDPVKFPDPHYTTKGWANSGLSSARTVVVTRYIRDYEVQNRYSPGKGAIVLKGAFYIHGGPSDESDYGFGSAGCVEIIGNYDSFKSDIASLSGSARNAATEADFAIEDLVGSRKLIVDIKLASAPDIKKLLSRKVPTTNIRPFEARLSRIR